MSNELTSLVNSLTIGSEIFLISFFSTLLTIVVCIVIYKILKEIFKNKIPNISELMFLFSCLISFSLFYCYFINKEYKESYNGITQIKTKIVELYSDKNIDFTKLDSIIKSKLDNDNKITYLEYYFISCEIDNILDYIKNYNDNIEKEKKQITLKNAKEELIKGLKNESK